MWTTSLKVYLSLYLSLSFVGQIIFYNDLNSYLLYWSTYISTKKVQAYRFHFKRNIIFTISSWLPNQMISLILIFGFLCQSSYFNTQMTEKYSTAMCYTISIAGIIIRQGHSGTRVLPSFVKIYTLHKIKSMWCLEQCISRMIYYNIVLHNFF